MRLGKKAEVVQVGLGLTFRIEENTRWVINYKRNQKGNYYSTDVYRINNENVKEIGPWKCF